MPSSGDDRGARPTFAMVPKTIGAELLLAAMLPVNLAVTAAALIKTAIDRPVPDVAAQPKTVLVSGGKMTKALQLARSFHQAGHRVILVESHKYRFTGHRFSRAVDRFYAVPKPQEDGYAQALLDIVRAERVDVYVPVCSPVASYYDALAEPLLAPYCEVLHCDAEMIARLDDKAEFAAMASALGLSVPDSHRVTAPEQITGFDFTERPGPYILKSIPYDPLNRLDLTPLPAASAEQTAEFVAGKDISERVPWIMQEFIRGQEYCTHATARDGELQVYCCCESSAFQLNYAMVDKPEIEKWVRAFIGGLRLTGQVSFDFIEARGVPKDPSGAGDLRGARGPIGAGSDGGAGPVYAIECNPRTHSAITMFYNHPGLARAYLERDVPMIRPLESSRPTYWLYQELWRLLRHPSTVRERLQVIVHGKDAIFDWHDPLPFLLEHHLQIPWLLLGNLRRRKDWIRIDFNIGKLVEPAGD